MDPDFPRHFDSKHAISRKIGRVLSRPSRFDVASRPEAATVELCPDFRPLERGGVVKERNPPEFALENLKAPPRSRLRPALLG